MTRIALVTAFPPSAGSLNEYGLHLARAFAQRADVEKLIILADQYEGSDPELTLDDKIEVRRVWRFNDWSTPLRIAGAAKRARVDGVVFNLQTASFGDREIPAALGLLSPYFSRFRGVRTGVIAHNLIDAIEVEKTAIGGNPLRAGMIRLAGKMITRVLLKADYVTVTLDSFAELLETRYRARNVYMVPHGTFPGPKLDLVPIGERELIVSTLGKFGTYKRLGRLIEAFTFIRARYPEHPLKLRIGGTDHPAAQGYLSALEDEHRGNPDIEFLGYVDEEAVAGFFASSRLAVFDYDTTTGSSGVLHQAAGFGVPAAYPLIGDFIDVTEREGLSGFHYTPFDAASLAKAIEAALLDTRTADEIVARNLAVSEAFPMATIAAFHVGMLTQVRAGKRQIRKLSPQSL